MTPITPPRLQFVVPRSVVVVLAFVVVILPANVLWIWLPHHREQQAVAEIRSWGGDVATAPGGSAWLRSFVGDRRMGVFGRVSSVFLHKCNIPTGGLSCLAQLKKLEGTLALSEANVADGDLIHLSGLTKLLHLQLRGAAIGDDGLVYLAALTNLEGLDLEETQVSNAGLMHLSAIPKLKDLKLDGTQVSDSGLAHLSAMASRLRSLSLRRTAVSDAGLIHLRGMTNIYQIDLSETPVSDAAVESLQKALPHCQIVR